MGFTLLNEQIREANEEAELAIRVQRLREQTNMPNRYDLEERLETNRLDEAIRRGQQATDEIQGLAGSLIRQLTQEGYNFSDMGLPYPDLFKVKGVKKDELYFAESAKLMLRASREEAFESEELKNALLQFQSAQTVSDFGQLYLKEFIKQNSFVDDLELAKYALVHDVQSDGSHFGLHFQTKYFDTPFNFCLTYEGKLIASVGFKPDEGRLYVEQIQGIRGEGDKLKPFRWEKALLNYAVDFAKRYGVPEVAVVSVDNNKWTHRHGHLNREQGKMLYDVTAKRCGFRKDQTNDYVMCFSAN